MIVRDLLSILVSNQIVEFRKLGTYQAHRLSSFTEDVLEKTKYIDCEIILMQTYVEDNQAILRLLVFER